MDNQKAPLYTSKGGKNQLSCYDTYMLLKRVGLIVSLLGLMLILSLGLDSTTSTESYSLAIQAPSQLAASQPVGSVLAQATPVAPLATPSSFPKYDKAEADKMCPQSSATACYFTGNQNKYVCDNPQKSKCDNATAAPAGTTVQSMLPLESQTAAAALAQAQCKSPEKSKENLSMKECHANGPDGKQITQGHCVAYNNCVAQKILVNGEWKTPTTQVAGPNTGSSGTTPGGTATPAIPVEPAKPVPQAPAPARPEIDNAYKPTTPGGTPTPATPGGTGAATPGTTPGGTPATPSTGGTPTAGGSPVTPTPLPTGQQPAVLTPINQPINPTAPFTPQPAYTPYPQAPKPQTTFGNTKGQESTYQNNRPRPNNAFASFFTSFLSGLFPASSGGGGGSVTYVQNIINTNQSQPVRALPPLSQPQTPQPQTSPPKTSTPTPQKNSEPVIIVVPYSSTNQAVTDFDALILALNKQRDERLDARGLAVSDGNVDTSPNSSSGAGARPELLFPEETSERIVAKPRTREEIEAAYMKAAATTTESTSTPRRLPPSVVEVGVAVDITDPASYESIRAYMNGEWAHVERTAVQNKAALAQAESERESIIAHLEALREAREAGICDEICEEAYRVLQQDLPQTESRIDALETEIKEEVTPRPVPPPTVAQIARVAESLAEPTYEPSVGITPRNPTAAPAVANVASQETPAPSSETKGEAVVLKIVKGVWDFLKSWFLPSPEVQAPKEPCSLFLSLFGKCK